MTDREKAIAAYNAGILNETIVIYPAGKRTARNVKTSRGSQIRLYLGGHIWQRGVTIEQAMAWVA